ncbi:CBS domain-containing protein [Hwanghaeella sp.]|uniref:CBS domain-containing protein n=1 Tax=Hwanghaeella sp. TaxID=2605943 RepID=UPI003CCB8922
MSDKDYTSVVDVMVRELHTIDRLATVQEAIDMMREFRVTSLVVERRDLADEFGLVAIDDIARKVIAEGRSTVRTSIYEIMVKPVLTLPADMNVKYAVRLLGRVGMDRALVVDNERHPLGMATLRDIVYRHKDVS